MQGAGVGGMHAVVLSIPLHRMPLPQGGVHKGILMLYDRPSLCILPVLITILSYRLWTLGITLGLLIGSAFLTLNNSWRGIFCERNTWIFDDICN